MKILLINPPSKNLLKANLPTPLEGTGDDGLYPPLGLLYLASYVREKSNHQVNVLDTQVENLSYKSIEDRIKYYSADVIGISAMTFNLIDVLKIADIVKKISPKTKLVLGGPHPSIYPTETVMLDNVDYVVIGEGEETFLELLNCIEANDKLAYIEGVAYKELNKPFVGKNRDFSKNLDDLPFPAIDLVPFNKYWSPTATKLPMITMITSRGCPFRCIFCNRPHMGSKFRARSAKNVVDEMQKYAMMGIKYISIFDDTFSIDKKRIIDIADEITRRHIPVKWSFRARVDTVDKEMFVPLRRAGCAAIHYGIEAGTKEILEVLRKNIDLNEVVEIFDATRKAGIDTLGYFMFGAPGETKEQMDKTTEFAINLNPAFALFSILTPFPATDIYLQGLNNGIIKKDYWRKFAENPDPNFIPPFWEEKLSRDELIGVLSNAYKRFYRRPTYIIRSVSKIKSFRTFAKKVTLGLKIIFHK